MFKNSIDSSALKMEMSLIGFTYIGDQDKRAEAKRERLNREEKKTSLASSLPRRLSISVPSLTSRAPRQVCSCREDKEKAEEMLRKVNEALKAGVRPCLCEEGEGGTYFFLDKNGKRVAVFKPKDEEPDSINNPKKRNSLGNFNGSGSEGSGGEMGDYFGQGLNGESSPIIKRGIQVGEAAVREAAAFVLDRGHFAGVPLTILGRCPMPKNEEEEELVMKVGSLQEYIEHECASWDLSYSLFEPEEVHKIGVLDLRLFNTDRHGGNILVRKTRRKELDDALSLTEKGNTNCYKNNRYYYQLIPIDHGFSLPDNLCEAWFEWYTWPQAQIPFSPKTKLYIRDIDVEEDERKLRRLGIREECIRVMKISTLLLKKGAERNLTLHQISTLVCRGNSNQNFTEDHILSDPTNTTKASLSPLEKMIASTQSKLLQKKKDKKNQRTKDKGQQRFLEVDNQGQKEEEEDEEEDEEDCFFETLEAEMGEALSKLSL